MKNKIFALLAVLLFTAGSKKNTTNNSTEAPVIFGKGIISTEDDEFGTTFTPDGKTCFFCVRSPSTISSNIIVICVSRFINGQWTQPQIASFSGKYRDFDPSISPDGSKLFFISDRPGDNKKNRDGDIWMVEKMGDGWREPKNIGEPVNTKGWELGCSVANDGTLYFSTTGISGNPDLYRSEFKNGKYQKPESLGDSVNSIYNETDPFISPDQSFILFASTGRSDAMSDSGASVSYPRGDIYISFFKNGKWTKAKNAGPYINSNAEESNPCVSPDGKTLYFTSERNFVSIPMKQKLNYSTLESHLHNNVNGLGDIYQIPISVLFNDLQQ